MTFVFSHLAGSLLTITVNL